MTESSASTRLETISSQEMRRFLMSNGFSFVGPWGRFLERFQLKQNRQTFDVLIPTTRDIADYAVRMRDALRELSLAIDAPVEEIVSEVLASNYRVFRIRAHPGSGIASIPFDEGQALLLNGKSLVRASAISAYSEKRRPVIRGRAPASVDQYMDRVQLGQSDVGSYVFNLLLPRDEEIFENTNSWGTGRSAEAVLDALESGMALAAEMSETRRVPNMERMNEVGLTANFCEALYNIVDWSERVVLELPDPGRKKGKSESGVCFEFDRLSLSVLERTAAKLAPEEQRSQKILTGTVTRLSEPQLRRRGSIDLRVRLEGRYRSVRINFDFADRETIISAFKEKDTKALRVRGFLRTERNGHLSLDEPVEFSTTRRGALL